TVSTTNQPPHFLFLVGATHRDILPASLTHAGWGVTKHVVYTTDVAASFADEFRLVLTTTKEEDEGEKWVVVFSPTGADTAIKVIAEEKEKKKVKVATIGPTTATYLLDVLGVTPDYVAAVPSPEGLWVGIGGEGEKEEGK